ncbi:unnamed protein product [Symbiodinium natans]|uniref:Uncharacterized protein n=1 Tax=Symbiodinium natans TaxID=878477 RepID=A0A812UPM4_9DINO|nr:unnamed protein product [Symbiodinium natans]
MVDANGEARQVFQSAGVEQGDPQPTAASVQDAFAKAFQNSLAKKFAGAAVDMLPELASACAQLASGRWILAHRVLWLMHKTKRISIGTHCELANLRLNA